MMADLYFDVDTRPMAQSVDTVRGHVNGVTAAVTAMEAAVIATERQAARTICDNVDRGFYVLVKSQISQKAVAAYSEMQAMQMTLLQLVKALDNVKSQMEADYAMISRRYAKLFNSLNKELEIRVRALDEPAMKLAAIRKQFVFDRIKDGSSLFISSSTEIPAVVETALNGKLKQKARDCIQTLAGSVVDSETYTSRVESILHGAAGQGSCFLPALCVITESLLSKSDEVEAVYTPQTEVWQNSAPVVTELGQASGVMGWKPAGEEEKAHVRREFVGLCERDGGDARVSGEIMRLFDSSMWETLEK
jgi:hypothetical protein